MSAVLSFLHLYLGPDLKVSALIILNLIVIESLLSVDNAAVLARMVMPLPPDQRRIALRSGIVLAYFFRGACLISAGLIIRIKWLKLLGGAYLLFLFTGLFRRADQSKENKTVANDRKKIGFLSPFLSTMLRVELMDLSFSIDNVFAAVAYTKNIILVCMGVFIGIIAMRVVAGYFVRLMERFPFLDQIAMILIGLLGLKLCLSSLAALFGTDIQNIVDNPKSDYYFSILTVLLIGIPVLGSLFFRFSVKIKN